MRNLTIKEFVKHLSCSMVLAVGLLSLHLETSLAQELFPLQQAASNVPKGTVGLRAFGSMYSEWGTNRYLTSLRFMYGLTPKVTVLVTSSLSNHHSSRLPKDLLYHLHDYANANTVFKTNSIRRGLVYPYQFNGIHLYVKYRFVTMDRQSRHFRMALYGEYGWIRSAHDESEPSLLDDTKGWGTGLIASWLRNRWAISWIGGLAIAGMYAEVQQDPDVFYPDGIYTKIRYGNALLTNLSLGYRLFPKKYRNYNQDNTNLYLEFQSKYFGSARIWQNGNPAVIQTPALQADWYVEVYPGIQKIIQSNLRLDLSVGMPLLGRSYTRFYPIFLVGIQRYFYPVKKA